jgi:hypothetical protein
MDPDHLRQAGSIILLLSSGIEDRNEGEQLEENNPSGI